MTNQEIATGLARKNLPKCQPDIFSGELTLPPMEESISTDGLRCATCSNARVRDKLPSQIYGGRRA